MADSSTILSVNEPQTVRQSFTPISINEPPPITGGLPDLPDASAPTISALEPTEATIGDPSFRIYVTGEQFHVGSVIVFAGHDEPTTMETDGRLSTGVNMDVWLGPDTVSVGVLNGDKLSNLVDFTFLAAGGADREAADPDELEDEIEQAEDDGEFTAVHKTTTVVKKTKR
jgi:hypothetical protein